jgi:hypothetical protein
MIFPPVLIVGPSGSGKSASIKNLPPDKTVVLNVERKVLPFREAGKFNNIIIGANPQMPGFQEYMLEFDKAIKEPKVEFIVHESFTAYSDEILKHSKKINKGYDIYNWYADKIIEYIDKIKNCQGKYNFVTGIDELVEFMHPNGTRTTSRRVGVNGQKLENKIEPQFTMVLFTEPKKQPDGKMTYHFLTNTDGTTSAKSPEGMFETLIPNDLKYVADRMQAYWGLRPIQYTA